MTPRSLRALLPLITALTLGACAGEIGINESPDETDTDVEVEDFSRFDNATLRIIEPTSASFLAWGDTHGFVAEVRAEDGTLLEEVEDIAWSSSADEAWVPEGATFDDDTIDVGIHDLTAQVTLPNGDRLAHTVGGVLVQSEVAGTYVGTFAANVTIQNFPVACAGSAVLIVEPYGEGITGSAECLAQAGTFEIPLDFSVDALNEDGSVEGNASATIIAFDVDFPASGGLDAQAETLDLEFGGPVFTSELNGSVSTDRISRDAGL